MFFALAVVSERGMREYINNRGKIWTFLCEVKDKEEIFEVCRKNGTQRITFDYHSSMPCLKKKSFQRTNGRYGYDCPFRLMFRPYSNANNNELDATSQNSTKGAIFYRGEHVHTTKMPPKKKTNKSRKSISQSNFIFAIEELLLKLQLNILKVNTTNNFPTRGIFLVPGFISDIFIIA